MNEAPRIPNHRLWRRIGAGSYGEVWLATDAMGKWTAVKVVAGGSPEHRRGLEQEFRGLRAYEDLSSRDPRLLGIRDVGRDVDRGLLHYAMQLADDLGSRRPLRRVEGMGNEEELAVVAGEYEPWTLRHQLERGGRMDPVACAAIGVALAEALGVLHRGGLIHRDIKPSNIIFVDGQPKLADVGLVVSDDATRGSLAGTSGFVPLHGAQERSGDLYALGKVLYMMHTGLGVAEFPRDNPEALPTDPVARRVNANLRAIYDRACDPDPRRRHPTADAFREELGLVLGEAPHLEGASFGAIPATGDDRSVDCRAGAILAIGILGQELRRARIAHQATLVTLENRVLSRMRLRIGEWSVRDWTEIRQAAGSGAGGELERRAVAVLSGLDARLVAHWRGVEASAAAVSGDGRILVAGFGDGAASLVNEWTQREELRICGPGKVAWTRAGEPRLLQAVAGAFMVWEPVRGEARGRIPWPEGESAGVDGVPVLALSPDGRMAAGVLVGSHRGPRVVVWNVESGQSMGECAADATCLEFSWDGMWLGIGLRTGATLVARTEPFGVELRLPSGVAPSPVQALGFGRDRRVEESSETAGGGMLMAAGHRGTGIVIWDLDRAIPRTFCRGANWEVASVAFLSDGMTLISGGRTGISYWDISTGSRLLWTLENSGRTRALAVGREGGLVVSGATSEVAAPDLAVWEVESHRGVHRLRGLSAPVRMVSISDNGHRVAAISDEWLVGVWDARRDELLRLFEVPSGTYADGAGILLSGDGRQLIYSAGTEVRSYDVEAGRREQGWSIPGRHPSGNRIQIGGDGEVILSRVTTHEGEAPTRRWEVFGLRPGQVSAWSRQLDLSYSTKYAALAPGGGRLLVVAEERAPRPDSLRVMDIRTGAELWRVELEGRNSWFQPRFEPEGDWVAAQHPADRGKWAVFALADGSIRKAIGPCVNLGPEARLYCEVDWEAGYGVVRGLDDPEAVVAMDSDSHMLADGQAFSREGEHLAWGCVDGVVVVVDLPAVRERLHQLRVRE